MASTFGVQEHCLFQVLCQEISKLNIIHKGRKRTQQVKVIFVNKRNLCMCVYCVYLVCS